MLFDPPKLRGDTKDSLSQANKPGRVILIHTGVVLLATLLLSIADFLLSQLISNTGGLNGMATRSILTTIQSLLRLAQIIAIPFWQIGYTYYTLKVARGAPTRLTDLTEGFRRFGPVLRLKALMAGMLFLLMMVSSYAGSILFMMTPWATPVLREMEALLATNPSEAELMEAFTVIATDASVPILIICGLCFLAGGIFLFFRFRLADLWLMAHPDSGALAALRNSKKAMQGNWKAMFHIDLGFWWFYLLELLVSVLCYGDRFMGLFGLEMTNDAFSHYLIFFSLYVWAHMALYWWKRNEVAVTYAHAYLTLCPDPVETKEEEKNPVL